MPTSSYFEYNPNLMKRKKPPNREPLRLQGSLTVREAAELRDLLRERIAAQPNATLDLSGIESVDTIGAQLVVSAARSAKAAGGNLVIADPSEAWTKACRAIGIDSAFMPATEEPLS